MAAKRFDLRSSLYLIEHVSIKDTKLYEFLRNMEASLFRLAGIKTEQIDPVAIPAPATGGGDEVAVNSVEMTDPNFNDLDPAAPNPVAGIEDEWANVRWQEILSGARHNVSGYVPLRPDLLLKPGFIWGTLFQTSTGTDRIPTDTAIRTIEIAVPATGYLRNIHVYIDTAVANGGAYLFYLENQNAKQLVSVQIPPNQPADSVVSDVAHFLKLEEANSFLFHSLRTGNTAGGVVRGVTVENVTRDGSAAIYGSSSISLATGASTFMQPFSADQNTTEVNAQIKLPFACKLKRLYVTNDANHVAGGTLDFIVRKNGVDTALVTSIPASSIGRIFNEGIPPIEVSFAAGDLFSLKILNNGSTTTSAPYFWCVSLLPDSAAKLGTCLIGGPVLTAISGSFRSPFVASSSTDETQVKVPMPRAGIAKSLRVYKANQPAGAEALTFTLRKNGAATALTITILDNAAIGWYENNVDEVTFARGDTMTLGIISTLGHDSQYFMWLIEFEPDPDAP